MPKRTVTQPQRRVTNEQLAIEIIGLRGEVVTLTKRVDGLNLNDSADALRRLADNSDQLLRLAQVAPRVVEAIERDVERTIAFKYLRSTLNPFKPLGAIFWVIFTSFVGATAWNVVSHALHPT